MIVRLVHGINSRFVEQDATLAAIQFVHIAAIESHATFSVVEAVKVILIVHLHFAQPTRY